MWEIWRVTWTIVTIVEVLGVWPRNFDGFYAVSMLSLFGVSSDRVWNCEVHGLSAVDARTGEGCRCPGTRQVDAGSPVPLASFGWDPGNTKLKTHGKPVALQQFK
jgi:hypothetical protein